MRSSNSASGKSVPVLHRGQAPARRGQHVDAGDIELGVMAGALHALLLQLVEGRLEDVRPVAEALHADGALGLHLAHPLARLLRRRHRRVAALAEEHIRKDARRRDLVLLAAMLFADAPVDAVAAAGIANRGDAVAHPQLVDVLGRHALLFATDVAVQIDQAGHHVVAAEIHFATAGLELGSILRLDRRTRRTDRFHVDDAIAFDDDIGRTESRAAGAVDHGHAAQDQLRIRPLAFRACGCRLDGLWFFFACRCAL